MKQFARLAVAVVVLAGCRENSPLQQNQPAMNALILDGAHADGNKDFFFLPPLVANPVGSLNFDAGKFNSHLSPFVEVCELAADPRLVITADCKNSTRVFGPARMGLDAGSEQYQTNWDTKASLLNPLAFYRVIVRGAPRGTPLGFVDVDPVVGGMKNVKTGDVFAFQDGRTLPIKVRIEQGAFGSGNATDRVEQVVPNILTGGTLDITTNTGFAGARFLSGWLPVGIDQVVVIIERIPVNDNQSSTSCLNTGLEELEGCYRFRTDPDLHGLGVDGTDLLFRIPVIAGVCFQIPGAAGNENAPPFALHRREEVRGVLTGPAQELDDVPAPFLRCDSFGPTPPSIGAAIRSGRLGDIAKAGWSAVTRSIARVIQPAALHAVDLGAGGSTNGFSRFGFVREATMTVTAGDGASAPAGSTIQASVQVHSEHHDLTPPVAGQSVTFSVTGGGGTVSTSSCSEGSSCSVTTDAQGVASVTWRLGAGTNTIQASTTRVTNSPATMTATGTAGTFSVQTLQTGLEYPLGLWVAGGDVYLTETADHNTSFGGKRRLLRHVTDGGALQVLIDHPVNSDAVAVTSDGSIYLASYVGSLPGEVGKVSVAKLDIELGWIETPVADVAIAAHDLFVDPNNNIYLIGGSDSPTATNLYLLSAGSYASPVGLATGLGRSFSLTQVGSSIYYANPSTGQVRRSGEADELVFNAAGVTTMSYDGTFLYYGDLDGTIRRRNLSSGAIETLFSGAGEINALRYDAESQNLYFLRSGTNAAQFKDGSLNSIYLGPVIQ